ncbi:MAG TPA: UvrD-helicase domain-containing protein [Flexivirga sp.]|uniref:UvrD-helicase domain-containing protein n=1 Tax=Flexivirga sp. TaxID=1962927 RepID=UPI002BEABE82|nr:UvrD-helicase domain-containing protein [Flexivirga sp.]HWC23843.1 UvrD-helicase domain-containing protein [Flexivirga sp.]
MNTNAQEGVVDSAARQRIRERTDQTLFVDAGAGSGKTSALVARICTLVLRDGISIEKIAAVTFTERAGAELRERLRTAFERAHATEDAERAAAALDGLDLAAIGTLHAFAQRILVQHAIEAGIPPAIEVLDSVGSSVAAESRWRTMWRRMLDDDEISESLMAARQLGVSERQLQQVTTQLGNDWDLIDSHVLTHPVEKLVAPSITAIVADARALLDLRKHCQDASDLMLGSLLEIEQWFERRSEATDLVSRLGWLSDCPDLRVGNKGRTGNWTGCDIKDVRAAVRSLSEDAKQQLGSVQTSLLRNLVHWCARAVLVAAAERRDNGTLEFHDLLVLARELLRSNAEARASLHERYQRLLLDEFQDTDPIQIEIATRIAGGADAEQDDWRDIAMPAGSLFVVGDPKQSIYRFRRADIRTYLEAREVIGQSVSLTTNFRTGAPIIDWINAIFGKHITEEGQAQPAYEALTPVRDGATIGPPVAVLGTEPHQDGDKSMSVAEVRRIEADEVAAVIRKAIHERWTTQDGSGEWRALRKRDITILIPARTSLPYLEAALDDARIDYRSDASSLVYGAPEVRALFAAARAIADPSDELSLVTALRSQLFGCGDDDLWTWKRDGGWFNLRRKVPDELMDHPVGHCVAYLRRLHFDSSWMSPSEVLGRLATDRRVFELAGDDGPRARDSWRRLRYVIDQARAWAEVEHGGLRSYVAWAAGQAQESAQASESLLPELDVDAVRIMTIHAAKGLEFPMVMLSGLASAPRGNRGVQILWKDSDYDVRLRNDLATLTFEEQAPIDEQMSGLERARLMYVAATRARDHLVVSLHRPSRRSDSNAYRLSADGAAESGALVLDVRNVPSLPGSSARVVDPPPPFAEWQTQINVATKRTRVPWSRSASGLEGTEPDALVPPDGDGEAQGDMLPPGAAKGARSLDTPAWAKGRDGRAIGRAVHGALQSVDLGGDGSDVSAAAAAQCIAEGVTAHQPLVEKLARNALSHSVVRHASVRRHWREMYVGIPDGDSQILEGIIDLLYEDDDGSLVIVDYKTDQVPEEALKARVAFYKPQLEAYRRMVETSTGRTVSKCVLLFLQEHGAWERVLS